MAELGEYLKSVRENKGITIEEISETTKINPRYIKAIEEGKYEIIGGDVYCKGFIRNYARSLGLDPEEAIRMYKEEKGEKKEEKPKAEELEKLSKYEDKKKVKVAKKPIKWVIYLIALILIGVSGGLLFWQISHKHVTTQNTIVTQKEKTNPQTQNPKLISSTENTVAQKPANTSKNQPEASSSETKSSVEKKTPQSSKNQEANVNETLTSSGEKTEETKPAKQQQEEEKEENTQAKKQVKTTQKEAKEITLRGKVTAKTWVRVSVDGKVVFEGILNPPKDVSWTAKENIRIRVGNAGGIQWSLNGKDIGYFGKPGEVITKEFSSKGE